MEGESPLVSSIYTSEVKAHLSLPTSPGEVLQAGGGCSPPWLHQQPWSPAAHSPAWWARRGLVRRGGKALGKDWDSSPSRPETPCFSARLAILSSQGTATTSASEYWIIFDYEVCLWTFFPFSCLQVNQEILEQTAEIRFHSLWCQESCWSLIWIAACSKLSWKEMMYFRNYNLISYLCNTSYCISEGLHQKSH